MPNALLVGRLQRLPDLPDNAGRPHQFHASRFDHAAQIRAFDVLHHEEPLPRRSQSRVEDSHHSRMIDARERFHFLQELLPGPRILIGLLQQHFDHHAFGEKLSIACQIHDAHSAAAQLPHHLVPLIDHQRTRHRRAHIL